MLCTQLLHPGGKVDASVSLPWRAVANFYHISSNARTAESVRPDRVASEHAKCLDVGCMWKHVEHTDLPQLKAVLDQNRRVAGKRDRVTGYIDDSLQRR